MTPISSRAILQFFLWGALRLLIFLPLVAYPVYLTYTMSFVSSRGASTTAHPVTILTWLFVALLALALLWSIFAVKCWRFDIAEDRVRTAHGVLNRRYMNIPYARIQNVEITRSLFERLLGLSTLRIHTAGDGGRSKPEAKIPGMLPAQASQIAEDILARSA